MTLYRTPSAHGFLIVGVSWLALFSEHFLLDCGIREP